MMRRTFPLLLPLFVACTNDVSVITNEAEGDDPGECADGADNDKDGYYDCDDADCETAPDCIEESDTDTDRYGYGYGHGHGHGHRYRHRRDRKHTAWRTECSRRPAARPMKTFYVSVRLMQAMPMATRLPTERHGPTEAVGALQEIYCPPHSPAVVRIGPVPSWQMTALTMVLPRKPPPKSMGPVIRT